MRLAIIGAGPAGLATARAALAHGLTPVLFEREPVLGGVWRPGTGAAWASMTTNLSHHLCSFSEQLWPEHTPDFPYQGQVHDYLTAYAAGLAPRYGCAVTEVAPVGEGWRVRWREESGEHSEDFARVVIATGGFARPWVPPVPGEFGGQARHARDYRGPGEFLGKRVAVVGMSFSGTEITAELAEAGVEVTGVTGRPFWLLSRYQDGVPRDLLAYTRERGHQRALLPPAQANRAANRRYHDLGANPGRYDPRLALDPDATAPPHVVLSDRVPAALASGALRLAAGHVTRLLPGGLELADGSAVPCEEVIWATGYRPDLPLPPALLAAVGASDDWLQPVLLHGCTFHPDLPGLACVGVYRGPFFAVIELQARWAVAVLSGAVPTPGAGVMRAGIEAETAIRQARPRPQYPHGDYVAFADRLAGEFGVLPPLTPGGEHHEELWRGPVLAAHYRLTGPGADPGTALRQIRSAGARRGAVRGPAR
ncbi:dimethylaniline monooxygenase (N-oxide forming) [Crossiella equi]|uniref:Dimethylaniline monooxygenase (N-oxide forming) n=1 Tax=Crossiella equi TaxID=130796 RepID=A0ABS5AQF8_9PSEU|nr:FAD-dependent oxidoreductase [Crossiella equi]MBP2478671.1 dimethylaniline monooxygenase (N-oxide forming) [Crossiella equi]